MRRSTLIASAVVATVAVGSIALRQIVSDHQAPTLPTGLPTVTVPTTSARVGPVAVVDGVSHGWSHDAAGAQAAAVAVVRATGPIAKAGFISRTDLIRSIASTAFGPKLAAASSAQLSEMTAELGAAKIAPADLVWAELPLTSRIVTAANERATVDVWSVLVVGVTGKGAPRQMWRTVSVTIIWERDDWRIDDWTTTPGPTPALAAMAAISDVPAIAGVLSWAPVPVGGGG
jgi:hypothetical protein